MLLHYDFDTRGGETLNDFVDTKNNGAPRVHIHTMGGVFVLSDSDPTGCLAIFIYKGTELKVKLSV